MNSVADGYKALLKRFMELKVIEDFIVVEPEVDSKFMSLYIKKVNEQDWIFIPVVLQ